MTDPEQAPSGASLREELEASGAKRHARLADVSRYMLDHYDELHALKVVDGYSWDAIVAVLAKRAGFSDTLGRPVSVDVAKLAWSRINRRKRGAPATTATPKPAVSSGPVMAPGPFTAAPPSMPSPSTDRDTASAGLDQLGFDIRPARPRGTMPVASAWQTQGKSTPSLLSEDEVERRIADVARRQGGTKIPPPEVL